MKNEATLLLGGNEGNVEGSFTNAMQLINKIAGKVLKTSSIYRTEAWGIKNGPPFLNVALIIETHLSPFELLECLQSIETELGRKRTEIKYASRPIDIDILFYNNEVIETSELEIPHPRLHLRKFALIPLSELKPNYIHPALNVSVKTLLLNCEDKLKVIKI